MLSSIKGWRAWIKFTYFLLLIPGLIPFSFLLKLALANIKSIWPINSILFFNSLVIGISFLESSVKIFAISIASSAFKLFNSLLSSKTARGSIKTVEPLEETSWTNPLTKLLYSSFTGITYLSFFIVTILSCKYFEYVAEWTIEFNLFLISTPKFFWDFLIEFNFEEALSEIVFSSKILSKISFSNNLLIYTRSQEESIKSHVSSRKYSFNSLEVFKILPISNKSEAVKEKLDSRFLIAISILGIEERGKLPFL